VAVPAANRCTPGPARAGVIGPRRAHGLCHVCGPWRRRSLLPDRHDPADRRFRWYTHRRSVPL